MLTEFAFSADDLALTRFAVSPMWEIVTSFRLLTSGATHPVHRPWIDQVRPRVTDAGLSSGWLAELIPATGYLPDFLTPLPAESNPSLASELDAIRATSDDHVRADLDTLASTEGVGPRAEALATDPERRLAQIADEIDAYWQLALAPYWAKIRTLLDADVFHRARQVAEHGAGHLFNDLHSSLSWDDNTLKMVRRCCGVTRAGMAGPGCFWCPRPLPYRSHLVTAAGSAATRLPGPGHRHVVGAPSGRTRRRYRCRRRPFPGRPSDRIGVPGIDDRTRPSYRHLGGRRLPASDGPA